MHLRRNLIVACACVAVVAGAAPVASAKPKGQPVVTELASFAAPGCEGGCGSGSTVGPDGALYVTDGKTGRVLRIDPRTGAMTTFADGLPPSVVGIGGAMDVAFLGDTAYVLTTLVGPGFGQPDAVSGIYRVESDGSITPIADIGEWSIDNPPPTDFDVASGVQYSMQAYRGGFLVTDGHLNRVLWVSLDGDITEVIQFGNIVPTGLETSGKRVYMGEAGAVPHLPQNGKVVTFRPGDTTAQVVASGAPLITDVEFGHKHQLYAVSQGVWTWPNIPENAGLPADPNTGKLVRVNDDGTFTTVVGPLDQPTSLEFIGKTAFVVTLTGKLLRIDNVRSH
jgi:hypothetical protein